MAKNATSPITSHLSKLEPRYKDQNVPYGLKNTMRCFSAPTNHFGVKNKKSLKNNFSLGYFMTPMALFRHIFIWMTNGCRIQNQRTKLPVGTQKSEMTYDVIKGHWPLMTSVDLGMVTMSVYTMGVTSQHLSMSISPAKIPKFASFRRWNGTYGT